MWENNSESTTVMKKISFLEKDITLRKNLVQKAEDVEVLFEFLNENQVEEEEVKKELKIFSNLLKEFELKLILRLSELKFALITSLPSPELALFTENCIFSLLIINLTPSFLSIETLVTLSIDFINSSEGTINVFLF